MSTIKIEDLLCYTRVEGEISPGVTLVTGPNSAGKSCFATILAALTSHESNPLHANVAALKGVYVRDGQVEGNASLDGRRWMPPKGISVSQDEPPLSKPHAVGLVRFTATQDARSRAKLWEGLFLPDDAESVLKPHWKMSQQQLVSVLKTIERDGWDEAQKDYERKRREAGRQWGTATGEKYGSKKAVGWVPAEWNSELEGKSEADLVAAVSDTQDELRAITAARAIEQQQIDRAVQVRDEQIPETEKKMEQMQEEVGRLSGEHKTAKAKAAELAREGRGLISLIDTFKEQMDSTEPEHQCPYCGGAVFTDEEGELAKWTGQSEEEKAIIQKKIDTTQVEVDQLRPVATAAAQEANTLLNQLEKAENSVKECAWDLKRLNADAEIADEEASTGVDEGERSDAENRIASARKDIEMWKQWQQAGKAHENYVEYDTICDLLGPNGARYSLMVENMAKIRLILENIYKRTGWKHEVRVLDDYSITSGGRYIALCADNEKLKAQWSLQIAVGMLTGSKFIVLDRADWLDAGSWDGLKELVAALTEKRPYIHLVVCGTDLEVDGWPTWRLTGDHTVIAGNG